MMSLNLEIKLIMSGHAHFDLSEYIKNTIPVIGDSPSYSVLVCNLSWRHHWTFFLNDNGSTITVVTGKRYCGMQDFF